MEEKYPIIKVRYQSTNCYFIPADGGLLAFDAGWPGTYRAYKDELRAQGWSVKDIRWLMVSHFHPDHAGLAGVLLENGLEFVVFHEQLGAIAEMESLIARKAMPYHAINLAKISLIKITASREWLARIGIRGEVLQTNGHSADSVSLLLDSGEAFVGDLVPESMLVEDDLISKASWVLLRQKGARIVYPAHAEAFVLSD
ncbi:MAG TPA: MBL fold metallo-hydrolase [Anaerolineaceae bacterium]|jgi:glyoxylase-like metal-dependent hydrolase (beta-lactamase superfamily II)|nr:MBL fold metallo-hydrolase [Anaerolineaceae bacterium]HOE34941.1 MBL fold metallo-hydrolase [Anaerolineaceae bacterium]HOT26506.1 MBL fold metallo-hydrolase [Anaerolineaceae bacterium]HQK03830.1 MBL fold metallo-hydrolase [Anaerolineaceae bacterium]HQL27212.1 MBL fold metallo-hydrolase [Anaerolineaceae bacterium]